VNAASSRRPGTVGGSERAREFRALDLEEPLCGRSDSFTLQRRQIADRQLPAQRFREADGEEGAASAAAAATFEAEVWVLGVPGVEAWRSLKAT
jgi:hypothetical protein